MHQGHQLLDQIKIMTPFRQWHCCSSVEILVFLFADPESHILFFDIEALIIELLSEEYAMMSPGSLEAAGLISQAEYLKVAALTQSASPDAHKKIAGKSKFPNLFFLMATDSLEPVAALSLWELIQV